MRARLLVTPDVLTEGRIAITATDVPTLRSLQLKGRIADVEPMTDDDLAKSEQYINDFYGDIVSTDHIPATCSSAFGRGSSSCAPWWSRSSTTRRPGPGRARRCDDARTTSIMLSSSARVLRGSDPGDHRDGVGRRASRTSPTCRGVRYVDEEPHRALEPVLLEDGRNLAENPMASVVLVDPTSYDEYRLKVVFERTVRRGAIFDRLREDVDKAAAFHNMQGVFKLKAADVFRVVDVQRARRALRLASPAGRSQARPDGLAELVARLSRCPDLDTLVGATVDGLHDLFGYSYSLLLLLDESGERLFTIASHGYDGEGVGSEVPWGRARSGWPRARAARDANRQLAPDAQVLDERAPVVRGARGVGPGREVPLPGLDGVESRLAVPAIALGELVGVLVVESDRAVAFNHDDEALLSVVASFLAERDRDRPRARATSRPRPPRSLPGLSPPHRGRRHTGAVLRGRRQHFLDGDYLIKGVAGRILWSLLEQHVADGRIDFTNKEIRLDPSLELPGFRDNLDSRLILLKRRLDERGAPIRIEKTGRGRFRLLVEGDIRLEQA